MWVFLKDSWLSIVADLNDASRLLVRSRYEGDIERVFPGVAVQATPEADYGFRAFLPRKIVADAMAKAALEITYTNYKDSLAGSGREDAAHKIWAVVRADARRP